MLNAILVEEGQMNHFVPYEKQYPPPFKIIKYKSKIIAYF